jgi:hypothetical protein
MTTSAKMRYLKFLPTILIIGAIVTVCVIAIGSRWHSASNHNVSAPTRRPIIGSKIAISGEAFANHESTLILALQENCHFCSDSAGFYQYLEHVALSKKGLHLMIIMPRQNMHEYITKLRLKVEDIKTTPFDILNIGGTPTLILVDNNGIVRKAWIGRLPSPMEDDVLSTLGLPLRETCEQCVINTHD